jgi:hypothetical protein
MLRNVTTTIDHECTRTDSHLSEKPFEYTPIKDMRGYCLLGKDNGGPYESIGAAKLSVVTRGLDIEEWKYCEGFHVLGDLLRDVGSAEARITLLTSDGMAAAQRLLHNTQAVIVRGNEFVFRATVLERTHAYNAGEIRLGLKCATANLVQGAMLGDAPAFYADIAGNKPSLPAT